MARLPTRVALVCRGERYPVPRRSRDASLSKDTTLSGTERRSLITSRPSMESPLITWPQCKHSARWLAPPRRAGVHGTNKTSTHSPTHRCVPQTTLRAGLITPACVALLRHHVFLRKYMFGRSVYAAAVSYCPDTVEALRLILQFLNFSSMEVGLTATLPRLLEYRPALYDI